MRPQVDHHGDLLGPGQDLGLKRCVSDINAHDPNDTAIASTRCAITRAVVSASGPCNAFGDPEPRGVYVQIRIETATSEQRLRISRGAAEVLFAELQGVLAAAVERAARPEGDAE